MKTLNYFKVKTKLILLVFSAFVSIPLSAQNTNYGTSSGTGGQYNSFFGYYSGNATTSVRNVFVGHYSGGVNTSGEQNTFVGCLSGSSNTTGGYNAFFGERAGTSNTSGAANTFSGYLSGFSNSTASHNTFTGFQAGYYNTAHSNSFYGSLSGNVNTSGTGNSFFGFESGKANTTASYNSFYGNASGKLNTTGSGNSFYGHISGTANTTGADNSFYGSESGLSNTTGAGNTLIGNSAGQAIQTSGLNTAVGYIALENTVSGPGGNTGIGSGALRYNTSGWGNTAIGVGTMLVNQTGYYLTGLGATSDVSMDGLTNSTAIGYGTIVNDYDKIKIGEWGCSVIEGEVPYSTPSDARFKYNIKENVPGLAFIKKLKPVTYNFDSEKFYKHKGGKEGSDVYAYSTKKKGKEVRTGFLAQDIEKAANELGYHFDGLHVASKDNPYDNYSIAYSQFVVPLVKGVQEQQDMIEEQQAETRSLKESNALMLNLIQDLQHQINALKEGKVTVAAPSGNDKNVNSRIIQSDPNPFRDQTTIKYYIADFSKEAVIAIVDGEAHEVNKFYIDQKGFGQILISGDNLKTGTYTIQLMTDGRIIDTQKLLFVK